MPDAPTLPAPSAVLRWIAVVPAAIGAWFAVLFFGFNAHGWAEAWLCPADEYRYGTCYSADWGAYEDILMRTFAGVSAIVVVLVATLVAPSHRRSVAWATFVVGACIAIYMGVLVRDWKIAASAVAAGLAAAMTVDGWLRHQHTRSD